MKTQEQAWERIENTRPDKCCQACCLGCHGVCQPCDHNGHDSEDEDCPVPGCDCNSMMYEAYECKPLSTQWEYLWGESLWECTTCKGSPDIVHIGGPSA